MNDLKTKENSFGFIFDENVLSIFAHKAPGINRKANWNIRKSIFKLYTPKTYFNTAQGNPPCSSENCNGSWVSEACALRASSEPFHATCGLIK